MNWIAALYLVVGSACATLAAVQGPAWWSQRASGFNLTAAFAMLAAGLAMLALVELAMLSAVSVEAWSRAVWWMHYPVLVGMVAMVLFVHNDRRGPWMALGWSAVGLRALVALVNLFSEKNIAFRDITGIETVILFGQPVTVGIGEPSLWMPVAQLSLVMLLVFVMRSVWAGRHDEKRQWVVPIGIAVLTLIMGGLISSIVSFWGLIQVPTFGALLFLPLLVMAGYRLSLDRIRTQRLANELVLKDFALQDSQQQLVLATEVTKAGVFGIDLAAGKMWATPQVFVMFGLDLAESSDLNRLEDSPRVLLDRIHPEDRPRFNALMQAEHASDQMQRLEYRVRLSSGELRWHLLQASVCMSADGRRQLMGALMDITESKHIEAEVAQQRLEFERLASVVSLGELSTSLAHELNQPLTIIMSNAEVAQQLLSQDSPDFHQAREAIDDVIVANEHAASLIRRLRRMLGRGEAAQSEVAVKELIESVLQLMRVELTHRQVSVVLPQVDCGAVVMADRVALEQVMVNLISNACDAMSDLPPPERKLTISAVQEEGSVVIDVSDMGVGLPADPDVLFSPFHSSKPSGLGLGLAIAKSIVTSYDGELHATTNQAGGAVFSVRLPVMTAVAP